MDTLTSIGSAIRPQSLIFLPVYVGSASDGVLAIVTAGAGVFTLSLTRMMCLQSSRGWVRVQFMHEQDQLPSFARLTVYGSGYAFLEVGEALCVHWPL